MLMNVDMVDCWQRVTTCSQYKQNHHPSRTWLVQLRTLCSMIPTVFHSTSMLLRRTTVLRQCRCSSTWHQTRFS